MEKQNSVIVRNFMLSDKSIKNINRSQHSTKSDYFLLLIGPLGSPVIADQQNPSHITVYNNHDVKLKCEAVGDTPITVTWTHNGQVLQSKTSNTHLTLTGVTRAQEGFYNCTASNTLGKTSKMIYLHVQGMQIVYARESQRVYLTIILYFLQNLLPCVVNT